MGANTHTDAYAVLEISQAAFDEIKQKLVDAKYEHAIHDDGAGTVIDMHGIGLQAEPAAAPSELNPNHPVTQSLHDHWHKIAGLLMMKFGKRHVVITSKDIDQIAQAELNIAMKELDDGLHLVIVSNAEAVLLARKEGGLPV